MCLGAYINTYVLKVTEERKLTAWAKLLHILNRNKTLSCFQKLKSQDYIFSNKWVVLFDFLYLGVVNMCAYTHPAGYNLEALGAN